MNRVGRAGSGQTQNGGVVIEGDFIQPQAGETTRDQMGAAMFELRKIRPRRCSLRR